MKNNSKNRKLKYIREKNNIRNFGKIFGVMKVSDYAIESCIDLKKEIIYFSEHQISQIEKKYKQKITVTNYETGKDNDDFIRNLTTVKITLQRERQQV